MGESTVCVSSLEHATAFLTHKHASSPSNRSRLLRNVKVQDRKNKVLVVTSLTTPYHPFWLSQNLESDWQRPISGGDQVGKIPTSSARQMETPLLAPLVELSLTDREDPHLRLIRGTKGGCRLIKSVIVSDCEWAEALRSGC
ncbi:protein Wnt-5b [Platysternon megacephalum]|uniref:Protein Wnt-5b n=1 Tax=Platysternon megacephalum TaxID=55544 RepID=A0A4D9E286_9SAUR|nr:protein Wnt-5b [Platysternon megacephalum]